MIRSISFEKDWRCFKPGDAFDFDPHVTLVVGDQGTGKSSMLSIFKDRIGKLGQYKDIATISATPTQVRIFDFERDNPRTKGHIEYFADVAMRFESHGNSILAILGLLEDRSKEQMTFILDEPDMALSIRSINKLVRILQDTHHQVIAAVHNPRLISAFPRVLSVEHRCWMSSDEFIA